MKKNKGKKILISVVSLVLVLAMGCGVWYYFGHRPTEPVGVYSFLNIGMTEYWGDAKESSGNVTTDKIQTVYLSQTQQVTEIFVQPGDEVAKGDLLMAYDTTLTDLALERKRLDVEKERLRLEDAKEALKQIKKMKPMVIPDPDDTPKPPVDLGVPIGDIYQIISPAAVDGSALEKAIVCWLAGETEINDALLEELAVEAGRRQEANRPAEPAAPSAQEETTAPTEPEETSAPTEPESTEPVEPGPADSFYVVFKTTAGDTSLGATVTWQGARITRGDSGFGLRFFDASSVQDPVTPPQVPETPPEINSGYTASQIAQMRSEKEKEIRDLTFSLKMADAEYKIMQCEVNDGKVYAKFDGTVVSALPPQEALETNQPVLKVSGGGGFYIQGAIGELDKESLQLGQTVTIMDWNTGMNYQGTVESVGEYPVQNGMFGYGGMGNPNVSYYPFTVFVTGEANLQEGGYVSIRYSLDSGAQQGVYLEKPFVRTEGGRSYVFLRGEDGTLEKRYVATGKSLWGNYIEILSGVTAGDYIAFPYGKNVKDGAATVESDLSELYGY